MSIKKRFLGREKELKILESLSSKNTASLVVIKGRRRIGKSRLAEEFGKKYRYISISGNPPLENEPSNYQISSFGIQLATQLGVHAFKDDDWYDAFVRLSDYTKEGRVVILLDEISWLAGSDATFLGKLKTVWDQYLSKNPKLILILCGSVSSWIEKNILSSTGFVGRISSVIHLRELSIPESTQFLSDKWSIYEKFKILSVTGGVPKYLEEVNPSITAEQNIANLCFSRHGMLFREFNQIFTDLFQSRNKIYGNILYAIESGAKTINEITEALGLDYKSGTLSDYLNDLHEAGFIAKDYGYNIKTMMQSNLVQYRISDNYTNFYLRYISPNLTQIESGIWESKEISLLPEFNTIMGLQFENLVLNNLLKLCHRLEIKLESVKFAAPFFKRKTKNSNGVQVDVLIATKDILYVIEVKFQRGPIGMGIIEEMKNKISNIQRPKYMSYRCVLLHVNGISEDLEDAKYFDYIIDFAQLAG